jgi:hypothetical protein
VTTGGKAPRPVSYRSYHCFPRPASRNIWQVTSVPAPRNTQYLITVPAAVIVIDKGRSAASDTGRERTLRRPVAAVELPFHTRTPQLHLS